MSTLLHCSVRHSQFETVQTGRRQLQWIEQGVDRRDWPAAHDRDRSTKRFGARGKNRAQPRLNRHRVRGHRDIDQSAVEIQEKRPWGTPGVRRQ